MSVARKFIKSMRETGFVDIMKAHEFSLTSDYPFFFRMRGDLIDCLAMQPLAAGKGVRVGIGVVKLDMYPDYDRGEFPKKFSKCYRNISNKYLSQGGVGYSSGNWDTSGVGRFEKTFTAMAKLIESDVLPWFDAIDTNKKLYESIFEDYRDNDRYGFLLK